MNPASHDKPNLQLTCCKQSKKATMAWSNLKHRDNHQLHCSWVSYGLSFYENFGEENKSGLNTKIPSAAKISMQHKIVNMLDPQSHHNPQPKRSSTSGTLNMIPPWNIHTVKHNIIMGRIGICFTSVATSWWGEACCLLLCFPTGTCVLCCT